ncbi:MAG: hypothetical protein ACI8WT_004965, partial [Clostridium sp.]
PTVIPSIMEMAIAISTIIKCSTVRSNIVSHLEIKKLNKFITTPPLYICNDNAYYYHFVVNNPY